MAYEIPGFAFTVPASTDLSALQYRFMTLNTSGQAAKPAGSTAPVLGVLQNKPTVAGQAASIMFNGISKVVATASTLSEGDLCASSTAGEAIPLGAGDYAVGLVIEGSSGAAGRILSVALQPVGTT